MIDTNVKALLVITRLAEVVVGRQNACRQQFFLQDLNEIQQILRLATADVVDGVRRNGQAVLAYTAGRCAAHHPHNPFHNVIDIGEIAAAIAVVVDLDCLADQQLVGEAKIGHIRTPGRTIHRKEAQARRRNVIELAVAMRHQLIALLRSRIE